MESDEMLRKLSKIRWNLHDLEQRVERTANKIYKKYSNTNVVFYPNQVVELLSYIGANIILQEDSVKTEIEKLVNEIEEKRIEEANND